MAIDSEPFNYAFVIELSEERAEYVTNKIIEFNRPNHSPLWENLPYPRVPLEIYVLGEKGEVVGGLIGRTNQIPEWLEVSVIWVAEEKRRQGVGSQLMHLAEAEAKKRGCHYARLATSDYQALIFIAKWVTSCTASLKIVHVARQFIISARNCNWSADFNLRHRGSGIMKVRKLIR